MEILEAMVIYIRSVILSGYPLMNLGIFLELMMQIVQKTALMERALITVSALGNKQ
ncbi:hypothetical protein D3C76_602730 [compost metagenome]